VKAPKPPPDNGKLLCKERGQSQRGRGRFSISETNLTIHERANLVEKRVHDSSLEEKLSQPARVLSVETLI